MKVKRTEVQKGKKRQKENKTNGQTEKKGKKDIRPKKGQKRQTYKSTN